MGIATVHWNARNLSSAWNVGLGNHHYILIIVDEICLPTSIKTQTYNQVEFMTLGGFSVNGNMVFEANNSADVASARELFNQTPGWNFLNPFDWGGQRHKLNSPTGSSTQFAVLTLQLAGNYERNTSLKPLPYTLMDDNCASWVNTLFKVAGVPEWERVQAGQFWGIDAAEKLEIPERLFK